MAGYGLKLDVDMKEVETLPTGSDKESKIRRRKLFRQGDMNGNGIVSLAECDRLIGTVLRIDGLKEMKPVINRAFHAARDIVPAVGDFSPHYVDAHEFRFFLIYLKLYLELFLVFNELDQAESGYSDRRLCYKEFKAGVPVLLKWGLNPEDAESLQDDAKAVFAQIDENGGGIVLFDEFAHWALYSHLFELDGGDDADADMAEALEVLRNQKPNLCGRDLKSIKASKAKYRVDAPISGQGCLRGDSRVASGEALKKGKNYPGGLAEWMEKLELEEKELRKGDVAAPPSIKIQPWKASLHRCEAATKDASSGPKLCECGCGRPAFGRFDTCCTKCNGPDGPHCADCVGAGYADEDGADEVAATDVPGTVPAGEDAAKAVVGAAPASGEAARAPADDGQDPVLPSVFETGMVQVKKARSKMCVLL